jgi:hypothetical protein
MSYPDDLKTTITKLSNYSRSSVKIQNQTNGPVGDGDVLTFRLPANSLVDLSSFAVHANMLCGATGGVDGVGAKVAYLPCRDMSIIRRLTVEMNNTTVCSIDHYDRVRQFMLDYSMGESNKKYALYGNSDPTKIAMTNGTVTGIVAGANAGFNHPIILDRMISYLASKPNYVDTSITGEIIVTITLAPGSDCLFKPEATAADASAPPAYVLSDIYATMTKVSINDGFYYASIQSALAQNLPFKMAFKNFETATSKSGNQSMNMRTEIQSDSVDLAWFSFMHTNYKQTIAAANTQYEAKTKNHKYFTRSLQDVTGLSFNVNGQNIPNYVMNKADIYDKLLNDLALSNDRDGGIYDLITTNAFDQAKYFGVATCALHHPTSEGNLISGLSSEGTPIAISVEVQSDNTSSDWTGVLTVMSSRIVECYAGRNIVLIR